MALTPERRNQIAWLAAVSGMVQVSSDFPSDMALLLSRAAKKVAEAITIIQEGYPDFQSINGGETPTMEELMDYATLLANCK